MHEISNAQLFYIIGRDVPDGLLTGENQELPFARHIVSTLQHFHFIEYIVVVVFMGPEKTIIKESAASSGLFDHCGTRTGTVTGSDKFKAFRQLCKPLKIHTHALLFRYQLSLAS